jgi:hypothetical protein
MLVGSAKAAVVNVTPKAVGYWANEASFGGGDPASAPSADRKEPGVYQISLLVDTVLSAADTAAGFTGFGNVAFDVNKNAFVAASPTFASYFGIVPNGLANGNKVSYTDAFGAPHTAGAGIGANVNFLSTNADLGTSTSDQKFVTIDVGAGQFAAADPRLNITQTNQNTNMTTLLGQPTTLATLFVDYTGNGTPAQGGLLSLALGLPGEGFSLHNNTTGSNIVQVPGAGQTLNLGSLSFGTVPEPTSLAVLGLGGLAVAGRRRRA